MNKREIVLKYAMSMLGLPYIWGGDDPLKGFDCSGFVQECLAAVALDPSGDQTAQALFNYYRLKKSDIKSGRAGALAFYGKSTQHISHVGLCIDDLHMIEAGGGNSKTKNKQIAALQNAFIRIRPIFYRKDIVAVFDPFLL